MEDSGKSPELLFPKGEGGSKWSTRSKYNFNGITCCCLFSRSKDAEFQFVSLNSLRFALDNSFVRSRKGVIERHGQIKARLTLIENIFI